MLLRTLLANRVYDMGICIRLGSAMVPPCSTLIRMVFCFRLQTFWAWQRVPHYQSGSKKIKQLTFGRLLPLPEAALRSGGVVLSCILRWGQRKNILQMEQIHLGSQQCRNAKKGNKNVYGHFEHLESHWIYDCGLTKTGTARQALGKNVLLPPSRSDNCLQAFSSTVRHL